MTVGDWIAVAVALACGAGIMAVFACAARPARPVEPVSRRAVRRITGNNVGSEDGTP